MSAGAASLFELPHTRRTLHQIFDFYRKVQLLNLGTDAIFDDIAHANTRLSLSDYLKFLRDFDITPTFISSKPVKFDALSSQTKCFDSAAVPYIVNWQSVSHPCFWLDKPKL